MRSHSALSTSRQRLLLLAGAAALLLLVFWSQALFVPYWQDDYFFLLDALSARLTGESWLAPFFPEEKTNFWRPLGMESYWRFVEGVLDGHVVAAHAVNVLLLIASAAAVGWFTATFARLYAPDREALPAGVLAFFLYGVHASHFLPAAWAAAANDSVAVLFAAVALRFWLVVTTAEHGKAGRAVLTVLCLALALLSRDSAIVLPALGLLLTLWLRPRYRPSCTAWVTGGACICVALAWLLLRDYFTLPADPAYKMRFGLNVLRNTGALVLFLFNTPFEALRFFFFVEPSPRYVLWGVACFAPQAVAFVILLRGARARLGKTGVLILGAFFIVGCAPYFLLSVNCYPYYISLGLFAYAMVAGLARLDRRRLTGVLMLTVFSSTLATLGNFHLDSPSHIGRARWAERQLESLQSLHRVQPELFAAPLVVVVEDEHRFLGFRTEGIAYRLGIPIADILVSEPGERPVLVVPKAGDVYFRYAGP